jgi:uncharacterized coiled-coil protein SlyX
MSRRFGRNQKRRMRAAMAEQAQSIENLNTAIAMDRGLLERQGQNLDELRGWLSDIAERLGHYAIVTGNAERFEAEWLERRGHFQMQTPSSFDLSRALSLAIASPDSFIAYRQMMDILDLEVVADEMRQDMHCKVYFGDHRLGYAMSHHAIQHIPRRELIRRISEQLSLMLEQQLKEAGVRK